MVSDLVVESIRGLVGGSFRRPVGISVRGSVSASIGESVRRSVRASVRISIDGSVGRCHARYIFTQETKHQPLRFICQPLDHNIVMFPCPRYVAKAVNNIPPPGMYITDLVFFKAARPQYKCHQILLVLFSSSSFCIMSWTSARILHTCVHLQEGCSTATPGPAGRARTVFRVSWLASTTMVCLACSGPSRRELSRSGPRRLWGRRRRRCVVFTLSHCHNVVRGRETVVAKQAPITLEWKNVYAPYSLF